MYVYEHNGKKFISINGKDYFLLRGYQSDRGKFLFFQVSGKTPLHKEDLPSGDWEVMQSKIGKERVWTAFHKTYFKYNQNKDEMKLVFIGETTQGSFFLALNWINDKYYKKLNTQAISSIAFQYSQEKFSNYHLKLLQDRGNIKESAVLLENTSCFNEDDAKKILKGG